MQDAKSPTHFDPERLAGFVGNVLMRLGIPADDAGRTARLMVEADLTGAEAHGVFRLPQYAQRIRAGGINPSPGIKVEKTAAATALVDGDNGLGHIVMSRAADVAVELARASGVAWVGVRRSNHAGPGALYAEMPAAHGMVGIYSAVASANHMAPWGGAESLLGTNPIAIAIPGEDGQNVVLDMATSVVSYGTVKNTVLQGKPLGADWMIDKVTGEPITAGEDVGKGMLLPIGGYKGAGLALALGLLAGPLNGAAFGRDVIDFNADDTSETNTGHFLIALDIARFIDPAVFRTEVARHLGDLRNSTRLASADAIRLPGDRRAVKRDANQRQGVRVPPALLQKLNQLAVQVGMQPLALASAA